MLTSFWQPERTSSPATLENNVVLGRALGPATEAFVEFVSDYPHDRRPVQEINAGGLWRLGPTDQIDFHAGFGVDRDAPRWFVGLGYSVRFDRLF